MGRARRLFLLLVCLVTLAELSLAASANAANFGIGDTVEVYGTGASGLVVRGPNACDSQVGGKFDGDWGVVLAGPIYCNSYNRWKIRWGDGTEGWSAEDWLRKVSDLPCWSQSPLSNAALAETVTRNFPDGSVAKTGENIRVTAYAVSRAESGGNPTACGDYDTPYPGYLSIGLWQINTYYHPEYDKSMLFEPDYNAQAAAQISNNGQNWNAWCTWEKSACGGNGNEAYKNWLGEAREALNKPQNFPPTITAFSVSLSSTNLGYPFTISYAAMDDNGLLRAELWRANDNNGQAVNWNEAKRVSISGKTYSGSFSDTPDSAGAYWYGIHAVDSEGNWNDERNSLTGGLPGIYGPIKVNVISCTDECSSGQMRCTGNYQQTCGDYDADSCLEWGNDVDCGSSYCENWQANYCKNDDVYRKRSCYDKGCSNGNCFSNSRAEEQSVQDCGDDSYGSNYCYDNDVYRDFIDRGCLNSACFATTTRQKAEECPYGCSNGVCNQASCPGDANLDGKVDIFDLAKVGLCYGCKSGEGCWVNCSVADVKPDNKIDIFDLATVGLNYGKSC